MISDDESIDLRIIEMREKGARVLTIHTWLSAWDNFKQLDEQIVLAHILNVLNQAKMSVSRSEVRKCFNKHYNRDYHGIKQGYLLWLYKEFKVKGRSMPSKKCSLTQTSETKEAPQSTISQNTIKSSGKRKWA